LLPVSVALGVFVPACSFPGNKFKVLIYDSATEEFKLRLRGGTFFSSEAEHNTGSALAGDICLFFVFICKS